MPTYNFDCCADARTPASPTMPIAMPAAMPLRPHARPAARCAKPVNAEYRGWLPTGNATAPPPCTANVGQPLLWSRNSGRGQGAGAGAGAGGFARRGVWGKARTLVSDNHGNDQAVDTKHASHHNGDDRLHDQVRLHDTHGGHANATLGRAVGGTQVCTGGAAEFSGSWRREPRTQTPPRGEGKWAGGGTHWRRSARQQHP